VGAVDGDGATVGEDLLRVAQAAAVAVPDPELGERICLYVVLRADSELDLDAVRDDMRARGVAAYKWPERLVVVERLLSTKVGKIDQKSLREDVAKSRTA
jgi:non-ribosomal peptide synthetase component E (peptide arylation enzyme)